MGWDMFLAHEVQKVGQSRNARKRLKAAQREAKTAKQAARDAERHRQAQRLDACAAGKHQMQDGECLHCGAAAHPSTSANAKA